MISVTLGNTLNRRTVIVDKATTIKKTLEDNEFDYLGRLLQLNGVTLAGDDFDKTFADFGIEDKCYLLVVTKADNA